MADDVAKAAPEPVEALSRLTRGFMGAQVVFEAHAAGVFPLLEQARTAQEVAEAVGWPRRSARMLLDGLVALELVEKDGDAYRNGPVAAACLVPDRPAYQGHIVNHHRNLMPRWARMGEALRSGGVAEPGGPDRGPKELRDFILGMSDVAKFSAQGLLGVLDLSAYRHLLDLGGGPATYAIAFLQRNPEMRATVFDRPEVIPIAQEQVAQAGLEDRIACIGGDMTTDDFGSGYDLVLVSNIIHALGPDTNRALVQQCCNAMAPGGLLIIKDFLVDNDRSGPPFSLLFALNMLVGTADGDTYTVAEVEAWTAAAGLTNGRAVDLTPQTRLWLSEKP